jgi:hypothetical protein
MDIITIIVTSSLVSGIVSTIITGFVERKNIFLKKE